MIQEGDRRQHSRRAFHDAAEAFYEGHHIQGTPEDISEGGMFLRCPDVGGVRPGDALGILLDRNAGFVPPLFLYARVARIRRHGATGLGLRWERAGSGGTPADLASALELLFAKPASSFLAHVTPVTSGHLRSAYDFPRLAVKVEPRAAPSPASNAIGPVKARRLIQQPAPPPLGKPDSGPIGLAVTNEELDRLDVKVVHDSQSRQGRNFKRAFDVDAGIIESTPTAPGAIDDATGSGSSALPGDEAPDAAAARARRADRRVPVRLEGVMTVARVEVPVLVTGLALGSAFVETPLAPLGRSTRVGLRIDVPRRDDILQMWLDCALEHVHEGEYGTPPGIELKILVFDDSGHREELARVLDAARIGRR